MFIVSNVKLAAKGWRENPVRMVAQIIVSSAVGQGIFWRIGYDQLGVAMDPKKQFGVGEAIAEWAYPHLPHTATMAWTLKGLEVMTDFARGPAEGALYGDVGITPDGLANLFTQPLWSTMESVEKLIGAVVKPERVVAPEGVKLSIACIYGSIFRLALTVALFLVRKQLNRYGTRNIERLIRRVVR
jgi:hypothetical protein